MLRNSTATWGAVSRAFHWLAALAIFVLLIHGWWMTHLAARDVRFTHYGWHAELGYDLLALMLLRLVWRWMNATPSAPAGSAGWERGLAAAGHWGLYALTLAATLAGWALAGTFRRPLDTALLGTVHVPPIVASQDRALHELFEVWHERLSYLLAALVAMHVAAALWHHLIRKNNVLSRMLSGVAPG